MAKMVIGQDGKLRSDLEWRSSFTAEMLQKAAKLVEDGQVSIVPRSENFCSGSVFEEFNSPRSKSGKRLAEYHVEINYRSDGALEKTWREAIYSSNCTCRHGWGFQPCVHQAAVMMQWEKVHGPFYGIEGEYAYRMRLHEEEMQRSRQEHDRLMDAGGREPVDLRKVFGERHPRARTVYVDVEKAIIGYSTNAYAEKAAMMLQKLPNDCQVRMTFRTETLRSGMKRVYGECRYSDTGENYVQGSIDIQGNRFYELKCKSRECERLGYTQELLCPHRLRMIALLWDYADSMADVDATDEAALRFFKGLEKQGQQQEGQISAVPAREKKLSLGAKIIMEDGVAKASFTCGLRGERLYALRNLGEFARLYLGENVFQATKKVSFDFAKLDFEDNAQPLLQFILRRVREIQDVNDKLYEKNVYKSLSVSSQQVLEGSVLDNFYDAALGLHCDYTDRSNGITDKEIHIGHSNIRIFLKTERLADARGAFNGVLVSGVIPVAIHGASQTYILNSDALSRVSPEEEQALSPFLSVSDAAGYFRFQVGQARLNEYYYRVLPSLLDNPYVIMEDEAGEEAARYLPPEPRFVFYLDYDGAEGIVLCRVQVRYGEDRSNVGPREPRSGYRDAAQEERVSQTVESYFKSYDLQSHQYHERMTDDVLYEFMQSGVEALERYGEVQGTEFFRQNRVRRVPQVTVGISVKSGVMDLSVTSGELSAQELLELMNSYQKKKKYYRLKSGEFLSLQDDEELAEIQNLLESLDVLPQDVIRKKAHLPLFRALYLDRLLEDHDQLAQSRDRTFRALVKNFRTIKDAEYEVPEHMGSVLRPYQLYGFKWLKTCEEAGFGAILADEMGLGKTLQMISVFESDREGGKGASLVVCPASLVFNWQEEIRRFAPELKVQTISGTLGERKKQIARIPQENCDVYVTSYDLLKRDIALYGEMQFNICVLDEAQYIKNQKAAVTKAVKAISCDHRFALTGTPVENRLSELWSIFDYLMPGFLYGSEEFVQRFETPIARENDEQVTDQLKKMVGPFILRRRKEDVLKDLPAKLEEVRYTQLSGEQQRLYDAQVVHMRKMLEGGMRGGEDRIKVLAELTRIRQICCDPSLLFEGYTGESAKREACLELIKSAIDGGHRMLLFSQFTSMLALLEEDLNREGIAYYKIIGATPKDKRLQMVHAFNEGDVPVFLVSLKAGGTGLNLTGADVVIHYDPWWNLAAQNQATDRAHRIGQTRQVSVYRLIAKGTIEDRILELQEAKRDLADAILEGSTESLMSLSAEELLSLLS